MSHMRMRPIMVIFSKESDLTLSTVNEVVWKTFLFLRNDNPNHCVFFVFNFWIYFISSI